MSENDHDARRDAEVPETLDAADQEVAVPEVSDAADVASSPVEPVAAEPVVENSTQGSVPPPPPPSAEALADPASEEEGAAPGENEAPEPAKVTEASDAAAGASDAVAGADETVVMPVVADAETKKPRRKAPVVGLGALLVLGAYAGLSYWTTGHVAQGTTVAGIELGGQTPEQARETLEAQHDAVRDVPADVKLADEPAQVRPVDAGISIDIPATVDRLTGFTLDPRIVYARIVGGEAIAPVVNVDTEVANSAMSALAEEKDREPVDAAIILEEGKARVTDPANGLKLDREEAVTEFAAKWPRSEPIELPTEILEPGIDAQDVEAAQKDIVTPLLSGPVTVTTGEESAELTPAALTTAMSIVPTEDGKTLRLSVDQNALYDATVAANENLRSTGKDAQIIIQGGEPIILPSEKGMGMDRATLADLVETAALSTDKRTATIELTITEPDMTTEQAEALGVKEPIVEFATNLTSDSVRTRNLVIGSEKITNTLVLPGEEFSLLTELGPITRANGFVSSGVINSGFTAEAVGGGLSQLSTTTFNAGWLAGMEDVEHKPHSRYYSRYPSGREATLWEGQIDMVWRNNTPYGVLLEAWVGGGKQHVRLWSTKYWDVEVSNSGRYAIVPPSSRVNTAAGCVPEVPGPSGFTIQNYRVRSYNGVAEPKETLTWTYNPWHAVTCG